MSILRFRIRTLMAGVALVAVVLAADGLRRRGAECLARARYHEFEASFYLGHARLADRNDESGGGCMEITASTPAEFAAAAAQLRREASSHARLAYAYGQAAYYPWVNVPPDRDFPAGIGWDSSGRQR
jgi:hypothetical protein